ncbi:rhodanese-like domain-containing protein [Oceanirhabdus sp. W0125-5]|uniref:rhodanese-like domain-containing protein n=1 Tax=Oceanirhabdus sp. W0125-5 TaxID=2999116 RepID=UPI0022F2B1B0|nr:rhodanese-like domain-containing protein [Oceanirhabdus sp. W0125-5]WBW98859.1 rhodanese-like domain-containing protein [Oceanirhabdus sp. W0125-5]
MKNIKKILALFLTTQLLLTVGCGNKNAENKSMDLTKGQTTTEANTETSSPKTESVSLEEGINSYFDNMPKHIYKIGQADFVDIVKKGGDFVVLDIRSADDYAKGHIKGAINLPWGTSISDNITKIPQDKDVYIYCYSGQTAGQAVMTLNLAGISARSVNLGWNFGISKAEGIDELTETTANTFGTETYDVNKDLVAALDSYYKGLSDVKGTTYGNYKISEANLAAMIDAGEDFYLLSIRSAEDFGKEHIKGAQNIPWGKDMHNKFSTLPKDKKIVVYCYSGQTAGQTTAALRLLGYDAVSLNGGIGVGANAPIGWKNKGLEVINNSVSVLETGVADYFANMPKHIYKIGQADFVDIVKKGGDFVVLDIRSDADYAKGHIKGAINLPWGTAISDNITSIPQDKDVYIYCYSGQTAGQAVMTLNLAGISARSVNLGWNFGISKVEGIDALTETTANSFGTETYNVNAEVKAALDAYYKGLADVKETTYKNYKISEANLAAMIDASEDFYLLSIRSAKDFGKEHIKGAQNLPWGNDMHTKFSTLPKDKVIVVYCYSGQTAGQTTAALRLLGYDAVSLNGGIGVGANAPIGWKNKGLEVVK